MFKYVHHIDHIKPFVADKPEIRFKQHANGCTIGCYTHVDASTFEQPESLECRGIAFDSRGIICSRPLHKFFNIGERDNAHMLADVCAVYEKLDGSMIATALVDGKLDWRSKASFTSDVALLAKRYVAEHDNIRLFAEQVARAHMTAIFEFTAPNAQIVLPYSHANMTLLHVRCNSTGDYVMLKSNHQIYALIEQHGIATVKKHDITAQRALDILTDMQNAEGFVFQSHNGDMLKAKCVWYLRLHRGLSLRERDVAKLALSGELDDLKCILAQNGAAIKQIDHVQKRVKNDLIAIRDEVDTMLEGADLSDRKSFAIANRTHPLFSLAMLRFSGVEPDYDAWYARNRLDAQFGLAPLQSAATQPVTG